MVLNEEQWIKELREKRIAYGISQGRLAAPLTGYGGREWLIGLALAVLCTLLGHSLFSWCLKYLSPSYVSAAKLCEPVFSSLAAISLFGEVPGPLQLAGGAAVLGAVLLYTWAEREKTPAG